MKRMDRDNLDGVCGYLAFTVVERRYIEIDGMHEVPSTCQR